MLAQEATKAAVEQEEYRLSLPHVHTATRSALRHTQQSIRQLYRQATGGPQPGRYPTVLLAAALCEADEFGYFTASDVQRSHERLNRLG